MSDLLPEKLNSLLIEAAKNPDGEVTEGGMTYTLEGLQALGANPNATDQKGCTALMYAAFLGHGKAVSLLSPVTNINTQNMDGWTALMLAAEKGHSEIARILIENKARTELQDESGWTALIWAASNCNVETIQTIVRYSGADILSALSWAMSGVVSETKAKIANTLIITAALSQHENEPLFDAMQKQLSNSPAMQKILSAENAEFLAAIIPTQDSQPEGLTVAQQNLALAGTMGLTANVRSVSTYLAAILPEGNQRDEIMQKYNDRNPQNNLNMETINALRCFSYGTTKLSGFTNNGAPDYQRAGEAIWQLITEPQLFLQLSINAEIIRNEIEESKTNKCQNISAENWIFSNSLHVAKINSYMVGESLANNQEIIHLFASYIDDHARRPKGNPESSSAEKIQNPAALTK